MWLAMKFGVSLAMMTPLPRRRSAKRDTRAITDASVSAVGMTSRSLRYLGGLKKCVPSQWRRKSSLRPSPRAAMGIPEGFDVAIETARRYQCGHLRPEEGIGLQPARALKTVAGDIRGQIQQQRRDAGVGQVCAN